jgi:phospholipase C
VPFAQFEADAASGNLPDFSYIEPCLVLGHGDYHPAVSRALGHGIVLPGVDPPSSVLGGEAFLARIYNAYKGMQSSAGANVWNTTLLIGWDEPGGTYDHVPPGPVPPPDPAAPEGQLGFAFDRSGYRVPAILISPWVAEGEVFNAEHRHTSLIATLREQWGLGEPLTARDAAARTFTYALALDIPRDPGTWPVADPRPVPSYVRDALALGQTLSTLGKAAFNGIRGYAEQNHIHIDGLPADPTAEIPPEQALPIIHNFLAIQFPLLHPPLAAVPPQQSKLGVRQP